MNPYLVLGVARDADDQQIRRAYLAAIKVATPDGHPERFKALTQAYDKIKSQTQRDRYEMFDVEGPGDSPLEAFQGHLRWARPPAPLAFEAMKDFLRGCAKP